MQNFAFKSEQGVTQLYFRMIKIILH